MLSEPVAAASDTTPVDTGVRVVGVAVIATLLPVLLKPIAAARPKAALDAGVRVVGVGVIALLAAVKSEAVAAACDGASFHASIAVVLVAVVAALEALRPFGEVKPLDPVAAACDLTAVGAHVRIDAVAVIASLDPIVDLSVAAARRLAGGQALVVLRSVAVIALLKALGVFGKIFTHETVPARSDLTRVGAGIKVRPVAVVAGLTRVHDGVATGLTKTGRRAAVAGLFVAIVTLLKTLSAPLQPATQDPIAATRNAA